MTLFDESQFCVEEFGNGLCNMMAATHEGDGLGHPFRGPIPNTFLPDSVEKKERFPSIDWDEAFAQDFSQIDWLPGRFMEAGQQVALVGDGKVGKTLFVHDWLYRCVTGKPFLAYGTGKPLKVLYLDKENGLRDIITRMQALGATPEDLREHFDYRMFPGFSAPLETSELAVAEFFQIVDESQPDIIILDTVSRFIGGKENDSDTWLALYRRIHQPLKARGIACVRLDHMGKDTDRGSRGSSAKSQDVDHVWEMARTDEPKHTRQGSNNEIEMIVTNLRMKRTHTRTGLGEDVINIVRRGHKDAVGRWIHDGTRHELMDAEVGQRLQQALRAELKVHVDVLIAKGVPAGMSRDALVEWCRKKRYKLPGKTEDQRAITKAIKLHYEQNPGLDEDD